MHRPRYLFLHLALSLPVVAAVGGCAAPSDPAAARAHAQAVRAQHGDWQVVAVDGRPLAPASATTLRLGGDGFLRGHTGCGDFVGAYAIDADRLSPGRLEVMPDPAAPVAGRPPCAAAPLADQRRFLGVLERVNTFVLRDDGALLLQAPGEHVIEARR
ncbi:MAG TPA: META domain-containing protein [Ideonella sp.]|nr:META domain-containing protein [Ideonella sp.]